MESTGGFADVIATCVRAVLTFAMVCTPGAVAGYVGFFTQDWIATLAKLNLNVLVPCLILSNVGSKLQLAQLGQLWPLLAWSALQLALGLVATRLLLLAVGACCNRLGMTRGALSKRMVCVLPIVAAVQNSVGFPLPVLQTVCKGVGAQLGDSCFDDAVLYMFVYNVVWQVFVWTVMYSLLQGIAATPGEDVETGSPLSRPLIAKHSSTRSELMAAEGVKEDSFAENLRGMGHACKRQVEVLVNPALCALAAAVAVAAFPPLQDALFHDTANPLSMLGDACSRLGAVTPVIGCLLLSASLGRAMRAARQPTLEDDEAGEGAVDSIPRWAMAVGVLVRLVLVPMIGFLMVYCFSGMPSGGPIPLTGTMRVLVMLEFAAPASTNLIVMCQRLGLGGLSESLAAMYVPMYMVSLVTVPLWLSAGLFVSQ